MNEKGLHAQFTWFSGEKALQVLILANGENRKGPACVTVRSAAKDVSVTLGNQGQVLFVCVEGAEKKGTVFTQLLEQMLHKKTPGDELLARMVDEVDRLIRETFESGNKTLAFGRKEPPSIKDVGVNFRWEDCEFKQQAA